MKARKELSDQLWDCAGVGSVFVPTAFIPGIPGNFINNSLDIAISGCSLAFNALTLSPALRGSVLRPKPEEELTSAGASRNL